MKRYTIAVAGTGYVGLSIATLLSRRHHVFAVDIVPEKVDMINRRISPIRDEYIEKFFAEEALDLTATLNGDEAYAQADFVVVAAPTNYDSEQNHFDTSAVESVIDQILRVNPAAIIVIKSTIPVGFTEYIRRKTGSENILFSPEFLREGRALYDNLYPSRIIVGCPQADARLKAAAEAFAGLLLEAAEKEEVAVLYPGMTEAEAVKLFANTYLALRVAYFNELDTYAETKGLDTKSIIEGVCLDPRIGNYYNNPSFGYGGYCLPKDTKQLRANYKDVPENLISAIVQSNSTRKDHIAREILSRRPRVVGIYRLVMKNNSDNFRASAIFGIIERIRSRGIPVVLHEPTVKEDVFDNAKVFHDLADFKQQCDVIVANRLSEELQDVAYKVYTRDIYTRD